MAAEQCGVVHDGPEILHADDDVKLVFLHFEALELITLEGD